MTKGRKAHSPEFKAKVAGRSRRRLGRTCRQKSDQLAAIRAQPGGDRSRLRPFPSGVKRFKVSR